MSRLVLSSALLLFACGDDSSEAPDAAPTLPTVDVPAHGETVTGDEPGDPDDPAIWRNAADPAASTIITTDKTYGLRVFDLDGTLLDEYADGEMNNVDLRGELVAASDRKDNSIAIYRVDPTTRGLLAAGRVAVGSPVYGFCLGQIGEQLYAYVTAKEGEVVQFALTIGDTVTGEEVRRVQIGGQLEGCVVDDDNGVLFVGEEDVGVWKLPAGDMDGQEMVDMVGQGRLVADVEGMAIFRKPGGEGYLLVSSQGDSSYVLYQRKAPHAYVGRFHIRGGALDPATETDGLEVAADLGGDYAAGLLVVQDDQNAGFTRCFKLVRWDEIASALSL